jgi:hypothetical protein
MVGCAAKLQSWFLPKTRIFVNPIGVHSSLYPVEPHGHRYQALITLALSEAYCRPASLALVSM